MTASIVRSLANLLLVTLAVSSEAFTVGRGPALRAARLFKSTHGGTASYTANNVQQPKPTTTKTISSTPTTTTSSRTPLLQASSSANDEVVIDRDFRLAAIFLVAGLTLDTLPYLGFGLGLFVTALGLLFLVQTFRLSFVCDTTSFSLQNTVKESGENIIVGGENRWTYDSFVNFDTFPKGWIDQPQGPILVYFKETQTPSEKWDEGPGAQANSEEALAKGAVPGQVHFFPCIVNAKQLMAEWERRGCRKL